MEKTPNELRSLFSYLGALIKNPVQEIKRLPTIQWKTLILFQFCLCIFSVVFSNLLAPYAISLVHMLIALVSSVRALSLSSLFFYYFFLILYNRELPFIKIFTLVLFAHIPFAIFHLAAYIFPPADLVGLGISSLLMIIGLVENFQIPKKLACQLMLGLYLVFFIYWMTHLITQTDLREMSTPQTLDKIEREIQAIENI